MTSAFREIHRVGGKKWKRESGYHRRSLAETKMFRLKVIFPEVQNENLILKQ